MEFSLPKNMKIVVEPKNYLKYDRKRDPSDQQTCQVNFGPQKSANSKLWTFGSPFIRAFYMIFDVSQKRIGFVGTNPKLTEFVPAPVTEATKLTNVESLL